MLAKTLFTWCILGVLSIVSSQTVIGRESLTKQMRARDQLASLIFDSLSSNETQFIDRTLEKLEKGQKSLNKCNKCKYKLKFASDLIHKEPQYKHLVSLVLFKQCLQQHSNNIAKCSGTEFFLLTGGKGKQNVSTPDAQATFLTPYVNFFDNDFLQVLTHFQNSSDVDLQMFCAYEESACDYPDVGSVDVWAPDLEKKWPPKQPKHYLEPEYKKKDRDVFHVLHLSDTHVQLRYTIGSESNCTGYICCLPESFNVDLPKRGYNFSDAIREFEPSLDPQTPLNYSFYPDAHYDGDDYIKGEYYDYPKDKGFGSVILPTTAFGGYKCDVPVVLLNNTLRYIRNLDLFDSFKFTIFTGDLVDHDSLHADAELTKKEEFETFALMKHYLKNQTIFPVLGNHDAFPYAQMAPMKYDHDSYFDWNEELMQQLWTNYLWVPENKSNPIKQHYAGYSVETPQGLKIISLNSNTYYESNLWAYLNVLSDWDLFGQWQFLIDELVESEAKGQRVWILAHVPMNRGYAIFTQSRIFNKIVERFSPYTIASLFFGHTHEDQFHVLYKPNSSKEDEDVINMSWVSHSVTPIQYNNPAWRYYEVEEESFNIRNSLNFYTRLNDTFANDGAEPVWYPEYSARETYDPEGSWPATAPLNGTFWHRYVASRLRNDTDIEINQRYIGLQYRLSPFVPDCNNGTGVSTECYNSNWCDVSAYDAIDYEACKRTKDLKSS